MNNPQWLGYLTDKRHHSILDEVIYMTELEFRLKQTYDYKKNDERWNQTVAALKAWKKDPHRVYHIHYLKAGEVFVREFEDISFAGSEHLEKVVLDEEYYEIYLVEIFKVTVTERKTLNEELVEMYSNINRDLQF